MKEWQMRNQEVRAVREPERVSGESVDKRCGKTEQEHPSSWHPLLLVVDFETPLVTGVLRPADFDSASHGLESLAPLALLLL